jgi:beta-lactam-binding protein with PASTA domain
MQFAIHGREVDIPKLVGMSPADAERAASASGLQLVVERQFYSATVPEGKIMTQIPPPGMKVRRGWTVRVAQSLGPQRVTIPNLTGGSARAAEINVRRRGLTVGYVAQVALADVPQDQIASQSPPANASNVSVPKIDLLVSLGPEPGAYLMPNLTGQPLGSAQLALQDAGMHVGKVSLAAAGASNESAGTSPQPPSAPPVAPNPASMIVAQNPAPGTRVTAGSTINLDVR